MKWDTDTRKRTINKLVKRCRILVGKLTHDSAGAVKAPDPIAIAHGVDPDRFSFGGGMYKFVITEVNTNVGKAASLGVEKHQITGE